MCLAMLMLQNATNLNSGKLHQLYSIGGNAQNDKISFLENKRAVNSCMLWVIFIFFIFW